MTEALVTGGADGIGLAIARSLAAQGCRVTIADLDGAQVRAGAVAETAPFGILVNNAGIGDSHLPTLDQDPAAFRRLLDVHLAGW